jgi:hypothetical protein
MGLTSEQVHWIGGAAFTLVALLCVLHETRHIKAAWVPYLLPALMIAYGIESFLDGFVHGSALPGNYAQESGEHFVQGGAMLIGGLGEWLRLRGRLRHSAWALLVPGALAVVGAFFWMHAQHDTTIPPIVLHIQHRLFAVTLWLAALARLITTWAPARTAGLASAWLAFLLMFGLELLLYTEGGSVLAPLRSGQPAAHHGGVAQTTPNAPAAH